jgi:hypothetical protein
MADLLQRRTPDVDYHPSTLKERTNSQQAALTNLEKESYGANPMQRMWK